MALATTALKNGIKALHEDMLTRETDATEEYATRLSDLIEVFVKSGQGAITSAAMVAGGSPVTATNTAVIKIT